MRIAKSTRLGTYEIISALGSGGMGEVYLAEDNRLHRKVALKILPAELAADSTRMSRFNQEAMAAAALNHPHIAHIYEVGTAEGVHFIAMEYIDGDTLRYRVGKGMKLTDILEIASQASSALVAAHAMGIIHRDIKPENIMVRRDGYIKLLDFGLAKLSEPEAMTSDTDAPTKAMVNTTAGTVMGTAIYMSPEQAKGIQLDPRTDLWSLGVVLYELVTGHVPFAGESSAESISLILQREPAPLTRFAQEIPAELERIVTKALTKDREERYQTAKDMLIDLRNLKRKLEVDAELERTGAPHGQQSSTSSSHGPSATTSGDVLTTLPANSAPVASSTASFVASIEHHKFLAAMTVLAIVIAILGLNLYPRFYPRPPKPGVTIDSIAILPFVNQNNDPNTEYLADGIPESIINTLAQLPNLKVMSRNSVFHYKGKDINAQAVAKELNVQAVLIGRVTQLGDGLSINAELINAQDNSDIWGEQYNNRKLSDVFAVQEEIAKKISDKLRLRLSGTEQQQLAKRSTENLKAFQYYTQGQSYAQRRTREDLLTAVRYYENAINEDPNYALAYAGLADAYEQLAIRIYIAPREGRRKSEEYARKALALDENLAEAHAAVGQNYVTFAPYNFRLGDPELRHAIELSPSLALAHQYLGLSLVRQGRLDESLVEMLKARELDPLSSIIARQVVLPYYVKRDNVRALELLRQANQLGPPFTTFTEIGIYIQNGSLNEALTELAKAKRERKNDATLIYSTGMVYAAQRKRAEALEIIKELEEMSGTPWDQAYLIAKIYVTLNEKEQALTWLERGLTTGAIGIFIKDDPVWDPIRNDPRFIDLVRRMVIQS